MKIVLIADDSPVIRKVARRLLEDMGFVVCDVPNASEALESCCDNMPDIVLMDRDMPGRDSIETIAEIKALPGGHEAKVLYSLSEIVVHEMAKAKRAGACGFLIKPFDREVLMRRFADAGIDLPNQKAA